MNGIKYVVMGVFNAHSNIFYTIHLFTELSTKIQDDKTILE